VRFYDGEDERTTSKLFELLFFRELKVLFLKINYCLNKLFLKII